MKVLYISHHKERSGWGQVARDYILALDRVGIDVVPRAIKLGKPNAELPKRLQELEQKSPSACDVCIQHVLPHYMKNDRYFKKNIGIFEIETEGLQYTPWVDFLNLMDELWVPCNSMRKNAWQNGINKPIRLVPHTCDTSIYSKTYEKLNLPVQDSFTFYFIGEYGLRKHLAALLRAFHTEFSPEEPVELVLKVNKFGMNPEMLAEEMKNFCNKIKENLRLYADPKRYKPEIIITIDIPREEILRLHSTLNCFVVPSYGEAWCHPAFEAMAMGNMVIASATGGMLDYIDSERNGFLINGSMEPVFGEKETFPGFGTSREQWFNISISSLMKTMRRVYELSSDKKERVQREAKLSAEKYSYDTIGKQMKELLNV